MPRRSITPWPALARFIRLTTGERISTLQSAGRSKSVEAAIGISMQEYRLTKIFVTAAVAAGCAALAQGQTAVTVPMAQGQTKVVLPVMNAPFRVLFAPVQAPVQ